MKKLFLTLLFSYISSAFAQSGFLVPYRNGNLWGYADTNLRIIVKPKYDYTNIYAGGIGIVQKNNLLGYINAAGKEIVPPIYNLIMDYDNNYLTVLKGGTQGIIYKSTGTAILPANYLFVSRQGKSFFIITDKKLKKGLFNAATNIWLLNLMYENIILDSFNTQFYYYTSVKAQKMMHYRLSSKGKLSLLSTSKIKIATTENLPNETLSGDEKLMEIIADEIDTTNTWVAEGFILGNKHGFYKTTIINGVSTTDSIPALYDEIKTVPGDNDLLIVKTNNQEGVISIKNQQVIPLVYEEVKAADSTCQHGIFIVKKNGKYGLTNKERLLLNCEYDTIMPAHQTIEGFSLIQNNKAGAYIFDKQKSLYNILIDAKYDYIMGINTLLPASLHSKIYRQIPGNFFYLADISRNGKRGYISLSGKEYFKD